MVTFMDHALVLLALALGWCVFVYLRPRKNCRKCKGWGSGGKRRRTACGRCQATGKTMRLSARIVRHVLHHGRLQLREFAQHRREES